jgi:hypothetical protein
VGEDEGRGSAALGNEIKRIRYFECAFGVAASEVAVLIADIGDDGVTQAAFDIDACGRFDFPLLGFKPPSSDGDWLEP